MILTSSKVYACCNSGARLVRVIKILRKSGRSRGYVGDLAKIVVLRLRNRGTIRVKKADLHIALIIRVATPLFRKKSGYFFKFDVSGVILLNKKKTPIGTRIFGPVSKELRSANYLKIMALASNII